MKLLFAVVGYGVLWPCAAWAEETSEASSSKEPSVVSPSEDGSSQKEPSIERPGGSASPKDTRSQSKGQKEPEAPSLSQPTSDKKENPPEREPPRRGIQGPRDLLELFGIDESHFRRLSDGGPLAPGEEELVLKLLFRSVEFPLELLERWAHRQIDLEQLAAKPEEHQGEIYWLSGRVQKMEVCHPSPEAAERFMMSEYYLCQLVLAPSGQPAVAYVRTVPKAWLEKPPVNERIGLLGFFLKTTSTDPQKPTPMFAANRIAWYPASLLGDLGMDVGLLDLVVDRQRILPEEKETFYQLLAAMRRAKPEQIFQAARQQVQEQGHAADSVVPLFKEPALQRGRLVLLRGAAREVTLVHVSDPDIRARFGIDHYYQIALFTPDSQGNPVFICVPSLPPGMPAGEGIQYVEEVEVAAFFLKSWSYRVRPPEDLPPEKRSDMIVWKRQGPLLIGPTPIWYPRPQTNPHTLAAGVAGVLFVVAGLGLWWALWRAHRKDEQFRRRFLSKSPTSPTEPSFTSQDQPRPTESSTSPSPPEQDVGFPDQ